MSSDAGPGAIAAALAALILAGAGLFAVALPFRHDLHGPVGTGTVHVSCDAPFIGAFDTAGDVGGWFALGAFDTDGDGGGWFAYAPNSGTILSEGSFCVQRARTRVSWGAVALVGGLGLAVRQRRRFGSG